MNFFAEQDKARSNTRVLVLLFSLAVFVLILLSNLLVAFATWGFDEGLVGGERRRVSMSGDFTEQRMLQFIDYLNWPQFALISLGVCAVVALAILYKWSSLRAGGRVIAESLGGMRVNPNTDDGAQKQLINVVEEMALAASIPVPAVYLLKDEHGINAFAAGLTTSDAVIGITQGALDSFDREQLQGVIAHEYSHILNGDMRLNLRLIAVLFGILFIGQIGNVLLRSSYYRGSSRRNKDGNGLVMIGIGFVVIGWLGMFFGSLIKSAIGRQREYLADASAVQFTRNPDGIAGALSVIGGSHEGAKLEHPSTSEVSHLFFGQAISSFQAMFATHPPLTERIKRINPRWDGRFAQVKPKKSQSDLPESDAQLHQERKKAAVIDAVLAGVAGVAADATFSVEAPEYSAAECLMQLVHEPCSARAVLLAMLADSEDSIASQQRAALSELIPECLEEYDIRRQELKSLEPSRRLTLVELAIPSIKCLSKTQYLKFKKALVALAHADGDIDLFEWSLNRLVQHYCEPHFQATTPPKAKYKDVASIAPHYQLVLSTLAHYGDQDEESTQSAFNRGANTAGLYNITLMSKPDSSVKGFNAAIKELQKSYPLLKPRLLKGLVECAKDDAQVKPQERELVSVIASLLDCTVRGLDQA